MVTVAIGSRESRLFGPKQFPLLPVVTGSVSLCGALGRVFADIFRVKSAAQFAFLVTKALLVAVPRVERGSFAYRAKALAVVLHSRCIWSRVG